MTRGRTPLLGDYDWTRAKVDFEAGVYPAVIALRLGPGYVESDVWNLAESEGWARPAGPATTTDAKAMA